MQNHKKNPVKAALLQSTSLNYCLGVGIVTSLMISSAPFLALAEESDSKKMQLPTVTVEDTASGNNEGYKVERPSSLKFTEPLRDIPQSITVVPQELMEDQGATTLRDTLRNVPGISIAAGEGGGAQGDNLKIRGFAANNDMFIDGMRDIAQYARDPFNTQEIEVIKGPSSTYFGRGAAGGIINQVSKAPEMRSFGEATVSLGTDQTKRLTADLNQPLNNMDLEGAAFRLNVLAHDSEVTDRDVVENQRFGVAPTLSLGLGTETRATLSYFYLTQNNIPDYGLPVVNGRPANVNRSNYYGFQDLNSEQTNTNVVTAKVEHDINDDVTLRNQLRYSYDTREANVSLPRNANVAADTVTRNPAGRDTTNTLLINQTDVTSQFNTGNVGHTLTTGVEFSRETYDFTGIAFANSPIDSLQNPNPATPYTGTQLVTPSANRETTADSAALYALDTLKLTEKWEVLGGLRLDHFNAETKDLLTNGTVSQTDDMLSWRTGLTYKPLPISSIYVSYGTSFSPSAEGVSLSGTSVGLDPEENHTYEVGTKWDVLNKKLSLTGAVFRIEKTNARTPGLLASDPPSVLQGEQVVDGLELGVSGNLTKEWQVFAGYTLLSSEITSSNNPAEVGKELLNTPDQTFNLWTTYELPQNFQVGAGTQFVDSRYGNNINTVEAPSYWVYDAMVTYHATEKLDIQLNVYNLSNETYYQGVNGSHIVPGAGRTALLSTKVRF